MKLSLVFSSRLPEAIREGLAQHDFTFGLLSGLQRKFRKISEDDVNTVVSGSSVSLATEHEGIGHPGTDVKIVLSNVKRDGQTPKSFHDALAYMATELSQRIAAVQHRSTEALSWQVAIVLDEKIEVAPGSGVYDTVLCTEVCQATGTDASATPEA